MQTHDKQQIVKEEKLCFSYIRFSSKKQAKSDSERRQLEIAPRVAKEKGWRLVEYLKTTDRALSAWKGSNIATLKEIIKAANEGRIPQGTVMILEALDRLTRIPVDDAYQLFRELLKAGIEIYTDNSGRHMRPEDLNNPMSIMMTVAELDAAHAYSDKLANRVRKAWTQKQANASEKVIMSKMVPAWVNVDRKCNTMAPNDRAAIVKKIFDSYVNGKGIRTIMRELNAEKVQPFGKGNQNKRGGWSSTHVRRLLEYRGVIGEYQPCKREGNKSIPHGDPISDYYPVIVEQPLFYKVQNLLGRTTINGKTGKENKGHPRGRKTNVTNLFTGLVKCAHCRATMVIKQEGKNRKYPYTYLVCTNAMTGNGCKYHVLQYRQIERAVLTILFSKVVPAMAESDSREKELLTLVGELKQAQKQKVKWVSIVEKSEDVPDIAGQRLSFFSTKEAVLKRKIESLDATIKEKPLSNWQQIENTPENRLRLQSILSDVIEYLTIDAAERMATLAIKDPACSFQIHWPKSIGTNGTTRNPANTHFNCSAFEDPMEYLDDVLVWKSPRNVKLEDLDNLVTPISPRGMTVSQFIVSEPIHETQIL